MHRHHHYHCFHYDMRYCYFCNVRYCADCGFEAPRFGSYPWPTIRPWNPRYPRWLQQTPTSSAFHVH